MAFQSISFQELGVTVELSSFAPAGKVAEQHAILHVEPRGESFDGQFDRLCRAEMALLQRPQCAGAHPVFKRYFLSDAANQQSSLTAHLASLNAHLPTSVSCIQQPPLDGSKVAVWLYLVQDVQVEAVPDSNLVILSHHGYRHLWQMGMCVPEGDAVCQTACLLQSYEQFLQLYDANLADNCIRTWFYVRDVDTQYAGMVRARRENFEQQGLTPQTHFIASTGIEGKPADPKAIIQLGTYAVTGLLPEQQHYLYAKSHLNSTYEYGVTFERGTRVDYGDRRHVYISGTASINNRGEVVHVGDIVRQTHRMWENVEALLAEAETTFDDVVQIIVYLRDTGDYDTVLQLFRQRFPQIPFVITLAPVCRPTWLIEMECVAIKELSDDRFRDF